MLSVKSDHNYNRVVFSLLDKMTTDKQKESINKRINKDNVKLQSVYIHRKYSIVVLGCINTNLTDNKPFYFLYWNNGQENGRGYNFMENKDNDYILLASFDN